MAAPDPAPQLFKDSSCTGGGVHTCSLWMAGSETGLVAAEVTAPVKLSSAPGHVPVIVARAVTAIRGGRQPARHPDIEGWGLVRDPGKARAGRGAVRRTTRWEWRP